MSTVERITTLGDRIRQARDAAGLTQQEVATRVAAGRAATVGEWEAGTLPGADYLQQLPAALGCDGHWLLTGKGSMDRPAVDEAEQRLTLVKRVLDIPADQLGAVRLIPPQMFDSEDGG